MMGVFGGPWHMAGLRTLGRAHTPFGAARVVAALHVLLRCCTCCCHLMLTTLGAVTLAPLRMRVFIHGRSRARWRMLARASCGFLA
jgi:hypothetical protein